MLYSFSFISSAWSSPASMPPPPPPSPNDNLLDIHPRKSSFSTTFERHTACAFPSWPNRPSLLSRDSDTSTVSSYLSDEDLFFDDVSSSPADGPLVDDELVPAHQHQEQPLFGAPGLTTEQQIQMLRDADEEEQHRLRFMAQVHAHARAHQQFRAAQMAAAERETVKRKKRRAAASDKKRRGTAPSTPSTGSSSKSCTSSDRV